MRFYGKWTDGKKKLFIISIYDVECIYIIDTPKNYHPHTIACSVMHRPKPEKGTCNPMKLQASTREHHTNVS